MRTRRGVYPSPSDGVTFSIRIKQSSAKRPCRRNDRPQRVVGFDNLHDDLLLSIFAALASSASSSQDVVNALLTCKRFCATGTRSQVLSRVSVSALAVKASHWSGGAHRFLRHCAEAGNTEACFILGMISFYCLQDRIGGATTMAKAAMASHAAALYSLAVIQFNGSGGTRKDKDLTAGVGWCARAAALGHIDAMRELGHCLQDGYGVAQNLVEGRRLLLQANAREAESAIAMAALSAGGGDCPQHCQSSSNGNCTKDTDARQHHHHHHHHHPLYRLLNSSGCSLLSDFGCNVPPLKAHPANRFIIDWYAQHPLPAPGLRLCSHANCGRPETRRHEFRRCSACSSVNYCSRACQALDWKLRHKFNCTPAVHWENEIPVQEDPYES